MFSRKWRHQCVEITEFFCHEFVPKFQQTNWFSVDNLIWFDEKKIAWQWILPFSTNFLNKRNNSWNQLSFLFIDFTKNCLKVLKAKGQIAIASILSLIYQHCRNVQIRMKLSRFLSKKPQEFAKSIDYR